MTHHAVRIHGIAGAGREPLESWREAGDLPVHLTIFSIRIKYLPDSARCGRKMPALPRQ